MVFNKKMGTMVKSSVNEMSPMDMKKIFEVKGEDEEEEDFEETVSMDDCDDGGSDDNGGDEDDDDEDDDEDDEDDDEGDEDDDEDMPTPGQKIQLQNNISKKSLTNKQQLQQMVKLAQNNVLQGKKIQAVLGKKNNADFQGKNVNAKVPGAKTVSMDDEEDEDDDKEDEDDDEDDDDDNIDDDEEDDDDNVDDDEDDDDDNVDDDEDDDDDNVDDDEDMLAPGQKIQLQNNISKKSALTDQQQRQQMVKPAQNVVVQGKKNHAVIGKKNNAAFQGKNVNAKAPGALIVQQDGDEEDKDQGVEVLKKCILEKVSSLKQSVPLSKQPEGGTEKNEKNSTSETRETSGDPYGVLTGDLLNIQLERRKEQDSRCLFIKGFASNTKVEEIKALSSDILNVSLPRREGKQSIQSCFVEFENEQKAIENHKLLRGTEINGIKIFVDFSGEMKWIRPNITRLAVWKDRLLCEGIPDGADMTHVASLFPKSRSIVMPSTSDNRIAYVTFPNIEDAEEAFRASGNAKICGKSVVVLYPLSALCGGQKRMRPSRPRGFPEAKRQKTNLVRRRVGPFR